MKHIDLSLPDLDLLGQALVIACGRVVAALAVNQIGPEETLGMVRGLERISEKLLDIAKGQDSGLSETELRALERCLAMLSETTAKTACQELSARILATLAPPAVPMPVRTGTLH
jgi:hypothetical protein